MGATFNGHIPKRRRPRTEIERAELDMAKAWLRCTSTTPGTPDDDVAFAAYIAAARRYHRALPRMAS